MRLLSCVAVLAMLSSAAIAQPAPEGPPPPPDAQGGPPPPDAQAGPPPPGSPPPGTRMPMRARFEQANTTHDGKLTLDQAQAAHMMRIVRHFSEIDADHKGYITWQDMRGWSAAQRGNRGNPPPPPPPQ